MYPNNTPQWAPSKPLIVSDAEKLSYFAKANLTRVGLNSGLAVAGGSGFAGVRLMGFGNAAVNRIEQVSPATGGSQPGGTARDVSMPGAGQSVADFASRLSAGIGAFFGGGQAPAPAQTQVVLPDAGPLGVPVGGWVLAGVAVLGVGFLLLKK